MTEIRASLDARGKRFALVAARFNEALVTQLVRGAVDGLRRLGALPEDIDVIWVPGSFEVPQAGRLAARSGRYDAIIGLGVLIRGETAHFDLIAQEAARGLAALQQETEVPALLGIVTAENMEQAAERCGGKMGNRGWDAALAAVEMANLSAQLREAGKGDPKREWLRTPSRS